MGGAILSLFVRVDVGFWAHRKTMRLRAAIGDCALWLPLRLWSYAAQNQPDGDFKDYQADELAMLLGYSGNAQAMLEAFQQSGFMDGMRIHDWQTYNGYHSVFAERAKKAAAARWGKDKKVKEKKRDREEKRREEASIASSNGEASPSNASSMIATFDEFWRAYPKKLGKGEAEKAWAKHKCSAILPQILTTLRKLKISHDWTKEVGQFIPHPATWLNRKGWEDEPLNGAHSRSIAPTVTDEPL